MEVYDDVVKLLDQYVPHEAGGRRQGADALLESRGEGLLGFIMVI